MQPACFRSLNINPVRPFQDLVTTPYRHLVKSKKTQLANVQPLYLPWITQQLASFSQSSNLANRLSSESTDHHQIEHGSEVDRHKPLPEESSQDIPKSFKPSSQTERSFTESSSHAHNCQTENADRSVIKSPPNQFRHRSSQFLKSPLIRSLQDRLRLSKERVSCQFENLPYRLSQLTGYREIDKLKALVAQKESDLKESRQKAQEIKNKHQEASRRRAESVREVNDLLARKASWSDHDLARFTTLVRTDHSNEQAETEAKKSLEQAEARVDTEFTGLMQAILSRYHEEQVWSDKIRSLSTTFSLSITLINVMVFLAAIVLVEPYKRARVVEGVEERMIHRDTINTNILDRAMDDVLARLSSTEKRLTELLDVLHVITTNNDLSRLSSTMPLQESDGIHDEESTPMNDTIAPEEALHDDETMISSTPQPSFWSSLQSSLLVQSWRENEAERELVKTIGIGAALTVVVIGIVHHLSK